MEDQVWTVKRILDWIEGFLANHGDKNPKLSAQWLVSEALGVSRQTVSKWENGTSDPSTSNLLALARLYGVSVEELLAGTEGQA